MNRTKITTFRVVLQSQDGGTKTVIGYGWTAESAAKAARLDNQLICGKKYTVIFVKPN